MVEGSATLAVKRQVIILDDEKVIAYTLALIFINAGFVARPAYSGAFAIDLLDVFRPDLLIADVIWPG